MSFCDVINGKIAQFLAFFAKSVHVSNIRCSNKTALFYYLNNLAKTHEIHEYDSIAVSFEDKEAKKIWQLCLHELHFGYNNA